LGQIVARRVEELVDPAGQVDVVGFSMGALVARQYIQRGGGKARVRRFISIAGPHRGTIVAYAGISPGARDMRPNSKLLKDLEADLDPWGDVDVHCCYTPYDAMIVPQQSSILRGARTVRRFSALTHRRMIMDRAVLDYVASLLRREMRRSGAFWGGGVPPANAGSTMAANAGSATAANAGSATPVNVG
jgi:triacylglycerol lipase